jgi:branched-chain amino acid transport system substrate-binding protein
MDTIRVATIVMTAAVLNGHLAYADTINVGVIAPQSGPCAQWGVPTTHGVELWADEINAAGGIKDAAGNTHTIAVKAYDNNCYTPSEELSAARRAVLDDGAQILVQTWTPASRKAIASLVTENKVVTTSYGTGYLDPKFPYLIGSITGSPESYMYLSAFLAETHPEIKRVAIMVSDNSAGLAAAAYYKAGLAPYADRIEVVYNQAFDAAMASDMMGLMTPVAAAKPDLILELGFPPAQQALMIEAMQQFGYQGLFGSEAWTLGLLRDRVPAEYLANRVYGGYVMDAAVAGQNPRADDMYKRHNEKYGVEQWTSLVSTSYVSLTTIEAGIKKASAPTGEAILAALKSGPTVDQPLMGEWPWGGKDIYGADNVLMTPLYFYHIDETGEKVVPDVTVDAVKWWETNKAVALPALKEVGMTSN